MCISLTYENNGYASRIFDLIQHDKCYACYLLVSLCQSFLGKGVGKRCYHQVAQIMHGLQRYSPKEITAGSLTGATNIHDYPFYSLRNILLKYCALCHSRGLCLPSTTKNGTTRVFTVTWQAKLSGFY